MNTNLHAADIVPMQIINKIQLSLFLFMIANTAKNPLIHFGCLPTPLPHQYAKECGRSVDLKPQEYF